jgi:hypothetical protein
LNGGAWDAVVGNSQAAGAAIMSSFIDFFGARALQTNAELSGHYSAIEGCEGEAWKYGGLAFGQIVLEAFGAGGAGSLSHLHKAKDGWHLGNLGYHSLGKSVLKNNLGKEFIKFANAKKFLHLNIYNKHTILKAGKIIQQIKYWRFLK